MKAFILSIFICSLFISCKQTPQSNQNANSNPAPSPQPTVSDQEKAQAKKEVDEQTKAISDFISQNYKGWNLQGTAVDDLYDFCEENKPCVLHLINGSQNKVVTVFLRNFHKLDGTSYWLVYEARQIDLTQLKIEAIKESEKEMVLENLTTDEVNDAVKDEIIESWRDEQSALVYETQHDN